MAVDLSATDHDLPPQKLSFRKIAGPSGVTLDATSGALLWVTTEADGPSTNVVLVTVDDDGPGELSTTNTITIIVEEVNQPPTLVVPSGVWVHAGEEVKLTVAGADHDLPAQQLLYKLLKAPVGAEVDSKTGILTWRPETNNVGTNHFEVSLEDEGTPPLERAAEFSVIVVDPIVVDIHVVGQDVDIWFPTLLGKRYSVEVCEEFEPGGWEPAFQIEGNGERQSFREKTTSANTRFYRVVSHRGVAR
jgi:hypothetical protein